MHAGQDEKADSATVRDTVEVRNILTESLMFKGDHSILCLACLVNNSLVFYICSEDCCRKGKIY